MKAHGVVRRSTSHCSRQSAHTDGSEVVSLMLWPPFNPQKDNWLVLVSVRGWIDPMTTVQLKGLDHLKKLMTLTGTEPATFWLSKLWLVVIFIDWCSKFCIVFSLSRGTPVTDNYKADQEVQALMNDTCFPSNASSRARNGHRHAWVLSTIYICTRVHAHIHTHFLFQTWQIHYFGGMDAMLRAAFSISDTVLWHMGIMAVY
jgi:hypothetical protein